MLCIFPRYYWVRHLGEIPRFALVCGKWVSLEHQKCKWFWSIPLRKSGAEQKSKNATVYKGGVLAGMTWRVVICCLSMSFLHEFYCVSGGVTRPDQRPASNRGAFQVEVMCLYFIIVWLLAWLTVGLVLLHWLEFTCCGGGVVCVGWCVLGGYWW